jgi:Mannosyl-glycoprotein endo-beta-N-acetylglucosaminidase
VRDTISFSSLIEHRGELVGGSFKIERSAAAKNLIPSSKQVAPKPATKRVKSAAVTPPQPPAPATYQWARSVAETEYEVYTHAGEELLYVPPPPLPAAYYQQPSDDYSAAPGGIAHGGHTNEFSIMRRARPAFTLFGMTAIVFAVLVAGASQFNGRGGAVLSGMTGNPMASLAGQAAPGSLAGQAQPPAPAGDAQAQPHPGGDYNLLGKPSISVATIEQVLKQYNSPAVGNGQAFYDLGVKYGVDPAFMLAFYVHESAAGTAGAAVATRSVGNIICAGWGGKCIGRFRAYDSYAQAAEDWYQLITGPLYIGGGLTTPDQITPRYAPSSDNNDPNGYAKTVERLVDEWRSWQ